MITVVLSLSQFAAVVLLVVVTIKQKRLHPKKSRDLQQVAVECSHRPLPFLEFSPAAIDFTCVWPDKAAGGRCTKPLSSKIARPWATTIRNTIADDSPYTERVRDMLWEYAELCLCHLHRPGTPKSKTSRTVIEDWVKQWLAEIRALHDSLCEELDADDGVLGEGVMLYAQTTIPEPTSDDESIDAEERSTPNTPLKRETSDQFTPIKYVPGSFPDEDMFQNLDQKAAAGLPKTDKRRSSTPETPSPSKYGQAIRSSPLGVKHLSFKRAASATPKLGSTQTRKFELYPDKLKRSLRDVLITPLGTDESESGHVYIFTRRSEDNTHSLYVKIGKAENVAGRFKVFKTRCRYEPHLEYETARIPNAMRAELLIHTELKELRYIERRCSGCGGKHDEWFKTNIDTARLVVERWAQWMQEFRPYTQEGQLSTDVVKGIFDYKLSKNHLTADKMLMLTTNSAATQVAEQPSPENSHRHHTVPPTKSLEAKLPSLPISTVAGTAADSIVVSCDEHGSEHIQTPSPSPSQSKMRSGGKDGGRAINRPSRRAISFKTDPEQISSAINTEGEEAKVKSEPKDDVNDAFMADVEVSDSRDSYHDAESFRVHWPCAVEAGSELDTWSPFQQHPTNGSPERLVLPAGA